MRRTPRLGFHEPSLVPLADMLSNTVGIMVFILIFTVIAAGQAIIRKELPQNKPLPQQMSVEDRVGFVCFENRVMPFRENELTTKLSDALKKAVDESGYASFEDVFNRTSVEDDVMIMRGLIVFGSIGIRCKPKPGAGETAEELVHPDSAFHRRLASTDPDENYVMFYVYPDSQGVYESAREVVDKITDPATKTTYRVGWEPLGKGESLLFSESGRIDDPENTQK